MSPGHIILYSAGILFIAIVTQYVRALMMKVTPWWSIVIIIALLIGVPYILLETMFTTFGRGALFIGPLSVLVAYGLISIISIIHYSLRIKKANSNDFSDSVLDDSEI